MRSRLVAARAITNRMSMVTRAITDRMCTTTEANRVFQTTTAIVDNMFMANDSDRRSHFPPALWWRKSDPKRPQLNNISRCCGIDAPALLIRASVRGINAPAALITASLCGINARALLIQGNSAGPASLSTWCRSATLASCSTTALRGHYGSNKARPPSGSAAGRTCMRCSPMRDASSCKTSPWTGSAGV